tara:strand:+ start:182 stop:673 length:492 start_codon:yes stop_codon:yes gene_type:complete
MRVFLNTNFFLFLINGYISPISSFQDINHYNHFNQINPNINFLKDLQIANKNKSNKIDFTLKEIPEFSYEEIKKSVKQNKDPFGSNILSIESSSFEDLLIILVGLFKINDEKTAMFITKDGIKNYMIGDKIKGYYVIKDIDLISKKVLITNGEEQKFYKFPKK